VNNACVLAAWFKANIQDRDRSSNKTLIYSLTWLPKLYNWGKKYNVLIQLHLLFPCRK
jgi:hypothetical protein